MMKREKWKYYSSEKKREMELLNDEKREMEIMNDEKREMEILFQ